MSEFTLRLRRYDPESGQAPYWAEYTVDLEGHRSVLEGILQAKGDHDGSIGIRCSCRADRKSTRLNSSHANISYAVLCLKKKSRDVDADVPVAHDPHPSSPLR